MKKKVNEGGGQTPEEANGTRHSLTCERAASGLCFPHWLAHGGEWRAMNQIERNARLEDYWNRLPAHERQEFEQRYGDWSRLSDSQKASCLRSFLRTLDEQDRQAVEEQRQRRGIAPIVDALKSFGEAADRNFNQIAKRLDDLDRITRQRQQELKSITEPVPQQQGLPSPQPSGVPPTIFVNTSINKDCNYVKNGPKGCVTVYHGSDGALHGTCSIGDQVRREQILHRFLTTAFEKAGCPSNRWVRPCEYYIHERVRLGSSH